MRTNALPTSQVASRQARVAGPPIASPASRARPMGLLMAVIVAATMLGVVYLTQTLGSSATDTEIWYLQHDSRELWTDTRNLQIRALKATEVNEIVPEARKLKLKRLGDPDVLLAP